MKLKLKKHSYPGRLIVFEGTDGAGKTTMIELTRTYLTTLVGAERVLVLKQPTEMSRNTKLFQKMMYCKDHRDIDYRAVQLLTMSDRLQHGFETIEPALRQGKTVICDRYIYTSLANMLARGYMRERWFFEAAAHIVRPDAAFLAYVQPETAIRRIKSRPEECMRHLDEEQLRKTAEWFYKIARRNGFSVLDTSVEARQAFCHVREILDRTALCGARAG